MNMAKERSLTQFWPQLREEVETENIKITMRDGAQIPLRIYTPKNSKIEFGKRKVVFAYVTVPPFLKSRRNFLN
jgi:predicted acyl esterase